MMHARSIGLAVLVSMGLGGSALAAESQAAQSRATRVMQRATQAVSSARVRARIATAQAAMTTTVRSDATPVWRVIPMNARFRQTESAIYDSSNNHATDRPAKVRVTGIKAGDSLSVTALLPVSGHTGQANVEAWKNTNVYNLNVYHPDGQVDRHTFNSTGYVTPAEVSMKLQSGETRMEFHPTATSVGGFMPGRRLLAIHVP